MMRWFRRQELIEEMRVHQAMLADEGVPAAAFGNELLLRERAREVWGWLWLEQLGQDLRQCLRSFRRAPGQALAAVGILALGLGASTALFSVFSAVLVHPLPFAHPEQLVMVEGPSPLRFASSSHDLDTVKAGYAPWVRRVAGLSEIGFYFYGEAKLALGAESNVAPLQATTAEVSPGFLRMLGAQVVGPGIRAGDDAAGERSQVIVLGSGLARAWGSPNTALGRSVRLNGRPYRVVGVVASGFDFPGRAQAWIPIPVPWSYAADPLVTLSFGLSTIGRLRPGATAATVARELSRDPSIDPRLKPTIAVMALQKRLTQTTAPVLWMLLAAVGLLLLIACANVANLQLTRALRREHEQQIRAALGASRGRLARQQLAESLLLGCTASLLGGATAALCLPGLRAMAPADLRPSAAIGMDWRVLLFAAGMAVATVLLVGWAPALHTLRRAPVRRQRQWWRNGLSVTEVALAMVLLAGSGLLLQSFWRLSRVRLGFVPSGVLTAKLSLDGPQYATPERRAAFVRRLQGALAALPGVSSAAVGNNLPLATGPTSIFETRANGNETEAYISTVSAGYFRTLGIPLLGGRDFGPNDRWHGAPSVIVSRSVAARLWPGESPIGKQIPSFFPKRFPPYTVVGEVGDTRLVMTEPADSLYRPITQGPPNAVAVVVRASGNLDGLIPELRAAIHGLDPDEPVAHIATMPALVHAALGPERFRAQLLLLFAGLALLLSLAGLVAVISFTSQLRRQEFGIRMALGADPATLSWMVLRQGLQVAGLGLALGLAAVVGLGRLAQGLLFGVGARDPGTLAASALLLGAAAVGACWRPAQLATRVNPAIALREL